MPAHFVPARDSRHRTACFALYRALLRQVPHIQLPADLKTALGPINPVKQLVRDSFRRNQTDVSPRLVVAALQNGYKSITLLKRARMPDSKEHASILDFFRRRAAVAAEQGAHLAANPPPPRSPAPKPARTPLLTRLQPGDPGYSPHEPVYVPTNRPRPLSELKGSGRRRTPKLDDCHGLPFLRIRKPQTPALSTVLRLKSSARQARITALLQLDSTERQAHVWEDEWDQEVASLQRAEGLTGGQKAAETNPDGGTTFLDSLNEGVRHWSGKLNAEHADMMARGKALWKLVKEEEALARKEAEDEQAKLEEAREVKASAQIKVESKNRIVRG